MNIFRLCGDMLHLGAVVNFLIQILRRKSSDGISARTQFLYLLVFCSRYSDLFTNYISPYNSAMKLIYIAVTALTLVSVLRFRNSEILSLDTFRVEILLVPCGILALIINQEFTFMELLWTLSIYLEAFTLIPQIFLLAKVPENEDQAYSWITWQYVFVLGLYRAFYILNWWYRSIVEDFLDPIALFAGIMQVLLTFPGCSSRLRRIVFRHFLVEIFEAEKSGKERWIEENEVIWQI